MFVEILLFTFLGILLGFLTGLAPGIHPNTVFAMALSFSYILVSFPIQAVIAFVVSLAVSNTFFDFIPSIIFGAPEEDSALSVLPGHKLLLEGRGYEAIFLTVAGGLGVMLLTVLSLPAILVFIPLLYVLIRPVIYIILLLVVLWMIWTEKRRLAAASVFLAAGIFGFITLNSFPSDSAMFPALTGLFGLSTMLTSVMARTTIPPQKIQKEIHGEWARGSVTGWLAGLLSGLLPGLGSSQTGMIASQFLRTKTREFLVALGGVNTSNIFFTFIAFYLIGKTRSGAVWMLSQIVDNFTFSDVCLLVIVGVMVSLISAVLTLKTGRLLLSRLRHVNYTYVTAAILVILIMLVLLLSGLPGVLVSVTGTFMGLLTISTGVKRTHLMGFLVFPTIMYFSGLNPLLIGMLW
jgi:putative membrane protein